MNTDEIRDKIQKGRKVYMVVDTVPPGYYDQKKIRHFVISSAHISKAYSREQAEEYFWQDYENQNVPDGAIFWRRLPGVITGEPPGEFIKDWEIGCRFSIEV